ncbi:tRNA (N(6)-L-threonylcarbamoyladenosine(37)-C(2))-methylthiotransferase MtaB [Butyricicoccus sp. Marseille-Q5471]|uniref:tRNA (N(6)-L-threonylcarbamoyladenosine(37)-C(2))- methylthiotransferase MtaB n=1 Tax=Butyricicoccus sp. Marseille-Q5471 TaxID=3039493 RepID=UPI0024BCBFC0|nr:tRNA (N(6)-L-threonylcarbamoyladenosine(37)-C(2))-methylthiotransferase MtaB [Butyricicoccus sp. Marseille-Q5471]
MKFAFYTLGCKVNLYETQALTQLAEMRGHQIVEHDADAVIINTCTVTSASDHKNIRAFHKMRRENPCAVIAACGCLAELSAEKVKATGDIDLVFGTHDRAHIIQHCEQAVIGESSTQEMVEESAFEYLPAGVPAGRTRALLKIQDGCDNFCTYCIIPYARGHVRSMARDTVLDETARLQKQGVHEIVLTGIELSSYGRDLMPAVTLIDLLEQLLAEFPDMRFRLGSLDPRTANDDFCARLSRFDNLARHFHLSMQSGCDSVLVRMGRRYRTEEYYNNVSKLKTTFPDCSITTDLIVGFPQETEAEFAETLAFLERCAFASVHVFPFSAREGTRAAEMDGQLPQSVKAERASRAKAVAECLSERYRMDLLGRVIDVLPEHTGADGTWVGHGCFGVPVYIRENALAKNVLSRVCITGLYRDGWLAEKI